MFEMTLNSGTKVTVTAQRGYKPANWHPSGHHYRVTVKANRKSHTFDFWDSAHNAQTGAPVDLRGALACFAMDAETFNTDSIDDVTSGLKAREVIRVYKACEKTSKEAARLGLTDEDLQELADY